MFNVDLDHMRCDVGGGKGGARTFIAPWAGVRVVQQGPAGLAMRVAFGEPFGAICFGGRTFESGVVLRVNHLVVLTIVGVNKEN